MIINITLGWWIAPTAITVSAFIWAYSKQDRRISVGVGAAGRLVGNFIKYLFAIIVTLFAWLIWSLTL